MMARDDVALPEVKPAEEVHTEEIVRIDEDLQLEPRHRVLIHNDNVTTFEYVVDILGGVFFLSSELAEHVAWTAHTHGDAIVVVRPRAEAEKLAKVANGRARNDGYPLTFTTEPEA